jgi:hypothetical protein
MPGALAVKPWCCNLDSPIPPYPRDTICAVYGAIVAQARRPAFHVANGGVDIATGRFESVVPQ